MEPAWVLINASSDAARDLMNRISTIKGVRRVDLVQGDFDLVVAAALPDQGRLTRAVDDIRQLEGVEQVLVCEVTDGQRVIPKGKDPGWPEAYSLTPALCHPQAADRNKSCSPT